MTKQITELFYHIKNCFGSWEENVENITEKEVVKGTIRETDKYKNGIFVELRPNLVGLAEYKERLSIWTNSICLY